MLQAISLMADLTSSDTEDRAFSCALGEHDGLLENLVKFLKRGNTEMILQSAILLRNLLAIPK
eukprot:1839986-Rhodomonas_salina.1